MTAALTSAQTEVLDRIRPPRDERRTWPRHLRAELRAQIEDELGPVVDGLDAPLWVGKFGLMSVSGCERSFVESPPFEWSVPTARGTVVHKSIELSVHRRGEPTPLDLVEDAVALLEGDDRERGVGEWLRHTDDRVRTELIGEATTHVAAFLDGFPPIGRPWRPTCESPRRVELCDDRLVLGGRFDLTLGLPEGETAGRVIIDLKTGAPRPRHREELRYYALLEAMKIGVPPARVASFYLESGRVDFEDVDEGVLEAALRQVVGGVRRLVALETGATPVERAGPACRWCSLRADCRTGTAWVAEQDDEGEFG
ncbi:MAG: PD-(D/E)XK nuclease family protein [Actinomycetota bacterium]